MTKIVRLKQRLNKNTFVDELLPKTRTNSLFLEELYDEFKNKRLILEISGKRYRVEGQGMSETSFNNLFYEV